MNKHPQKTATLAQSTPVTPPSQPTAVRGPSPDGQVPTATSVCEEAIRLRAFQKWEAAGKPQGNGVQFWLEAEQQLLLPKEIGSA